VGQSRRRTGEPSFSVSHHRLFTCFSVCVGRSWLEQSQTRPLWRANVKKSLHFAGKPDIDVGIVITMNG
jgi:hypothetical protein